VLSAAVAGIIMQTMCARRIGTGTIRTNVTTTSVFDFPGTATGKPRPGSGSGLLPERAAAVLALSWAALGTVEEQAEDDCPRRRLVGRRSKVAAGECL